MKKFIIFAALFVAVFFASAGIMPAGDTAPSSQSKPLDPANLDPSVNASDDFYRYANGGWIARNPVPGEYGRWGAFNELLEKNWADLHKILDAAAANTSAPKGSLTQKIGDFYATGMDSAAIESQGTAPLQPFLEKIADLKTNADLAKTVAWFHVNGVHGIFGFGVGQDAKSSTDVRAHISQGGLSLPDRDYYLKDDERSKTLRDEFVKHVTAMFALMGDSKEKSEAEAKTIMAIETRLATASMTRVQRRDPNATYHKMGLAEISALAPSFSWKEYFAGIGISDPGSVIVGQPDFLKEFEKMIADVPTADWATYFRWHTVNEYADALGAKFVNEDFHFGGSILSGAKQIQPRWKRIMQMTDRNLGEALGREYVEKYFPPEAKERARAMVDNLRAAFRERIMSRPWMSEETKKMALKKLDAFNVKIGYPDKWRDYSALTIDRSSFLGNLVRASAFEFKRNIDQIGKPVDRTEWGMTPPTVNAYYNSSMNEIVFPAGILQPPFFDPHADDAVNYGGMGAVIGHEITHGFDDRGSQFDAQGNLKDWWTPQDKEAFTARTSIVEKQFNDYVAVDTMHANGKLTLGENIADLGGLTISYAAYEKSLQGKPEPPKIDGLTGSQRFFLGWAQIWRATYRPEELRRLTMLDSHSLSMYRVNGPLSNMHDFFEAYHITAPSKMVRPEKERAEIW